MSGNVLARVSSNLTVVDFLNRERGAELDTSPSPVQRVLGYAACACSLPLVLASGACESGGDSGATRGLLDGAVLSTR
jgi:hypothetical protein